MIGELLCNSSKSLLDAMRIINQNAKGVCFVISDHEQLVGILTDGDIRRAILSGADLNESIECFVSKDFVYAFQNESIDTIVSRLDRKIRIIPIVDTDYRVVDYFEYRQSAHFPVSNPTLSGNEFKYLTDAFFSSWISSTGSYIDQFEDKFSSYSDCVYGVSTSNGTTALHLALMVLNIGPGDEVIVPNLTFASTINSVLHANATPVIVDIEKDSWCINPNEIERAVTTKTKAIIPVHLYGQPSNMRAIMDIADRHNLRVIEDCAEAHGATFQGRKVGGFGDIGCFSFYGNKVITTGEGGMCVTNNPDLDEKMRILRDHGMSKAKRYWHEQIGFNYRLTNLQAAIGLAQLERIEEIHRNRRLYEDAYRKSLEGKFCFQKDSVNGSRITWLVSALADSPSSRDSFMEDMHNLGIDVRPFFYPLSEMDIYKKFLRNPAPVSEDISARGFNLPTYESLKSVENIEKILKDFQKI